jgi:hypothetical protein
MRRADWCWGGDAMIGTNAKPLGHKGYGSIPHLPGSRMGPSDHHCHEGQQAICWEKVRNKFDRVIVTEKLDGSNVSVARIGDKIVALSRAGYLAATSQYEQHHKFAAWVEINEGAFLKGLVSGERLVGEWMAQAHGTRYRLTTTCFVAFDLMAGMNRHPFDDMRKIAAICGVDAAHVLSDGPSFPLENALRALGEFGFHGAIDPIEGAVWRVENKGKFDFIAKYVRHDKQDGKFLPELNGGEVVWNEGICS